MKRTTQFSMLLATGILALFTGCYTDASGLPAQSKSLTIEENYTCITDEDAARMTDQVLQLVNLERSTVGLAPVILHDKLDKVASNYACKMIEEGFFGHEEPDTDRGPGVRAMLGKYSFYAVGENLAAGQETATQVMRVWMESPSHKAIILDQRWKHIGISVRSGGEHGIYWVQEFGDPADY